VCRHLGITEGQKAQRAATVLLMLGECFAVQGARDALPRGRTPHALTLTYKLSLVEGGKITPRLPMMNGWEAFSIILQLCGHQIVKPAAYHGAIGKSARGPHIVASSMAV
jgi:hypothetical protein